MPMELCLPLRKAHVFTFWEECLYVCVCVSAYTSMHGIRNNMALTIKSNTIAYRPSGGHFPLSISYFFFFFSENQPVTSPPGGGFGHFRPQKRPKKSRNFPNRSPFPTVTEPPGGGGSVAQYQPVTLKKNQSVTPRGKVGQCVSDGGVIDAYGFMISMIDSNFTNQHKKKHFLSLNATCCVNQR